ncbi:HPr family phosphocarrier protein [Acetobacterium sp.]|jgi:phosphocarrier protein|uniref:HPr family phosphocarrier protein n=1 Tax=Acetobacterium sp. TaxID=1872094 RepID=UPI000CB26FB8|nr:HPr family phosphocarrier protein [Acetobacterium sp.]MDO9493355.1 HPr family phosphocarrier protein [Acetobacterium sp.]PKM75112.1 MAG: phosphocarrier protein HPr [Firmicutes bacterium HGW-Firmicutes-17]
MQIQEVTVLNETGIHARPASMFVKAAGKFKSNIFVIKADKEINAKSIVGVMAGGITQGTTVKIKAEGEDEVNAVAELVQMINDRFDE